MLKMQHLQVMHAEDLAVSFSDCGRNATVLTHGEGAVSFELPNFLRDHGCCSCPTGKQEFFCVHHLIAFCVKFDSLTRDEVCNHTLIVAGSNFGTPKGCQLGAEGFVPLVSALVKASARGDESRAAAEMTTLQAGNEAEPAHTEQQQVVSTDNMEAQSPKCTSVPIHDASKQLSPTGTFARLNQVWDAVANAVTPQKQRLLAAANYCCDQLLSMVKRPSLHETLVGALHLPAVRQVNTALPQEKRKLSKCEQFYSEQQQRVKRFALGERGDIVQPGTLAKASAALKRTANKLMQELDPES
jgi:hypothetical protein